MSKRSNKVRPAALASKFRSVFKRVYAYLFKDKRSLSLDGISLLIVELIEAVEHSARMVGSIGPWLTAVAALWHAYDGIQERGVTAWTIRAIVYASHQVQLPEKYEQTRIEWSSSHKRY